MNKLLLTVLSILTISLSFAQNAGKKINDCGTDEYMEQLLKEHPELLEKQKESERFYQSEYMRKSKQASWRSAADVVTIPVVVHVMHLPGTPIGTDENLSVAQIEAGILHLNQAYRKLTSDFSGIGHNPNITGVDTEINFCLALQDPNGNPTNGINRVATTLSNSSYFDGISVKNLSRWNTSKYLNIWLVKSIYNPSTGRYIGGYANYPSSHGQLRDGLVNKASRFGSSLTSTLSRTHIHEVGHYLDLRHTFETPIGSPNCVNNNCATDGDLVCDTPPEADKTTLMPCGNLINTCNTDANDADAQNPFRPVALGGLGDQVDLSENYMDYTDSLGNCIINTFTAGQKVRMRAALDGIRSSLKTSLGCSPSTISAPYVYFAYDDNLPFIEDDIPIDNIIDCRTYQDVNVPIVVFNTSSSVTVNVSVGAGTATNISDFQLMTPTVTIPAGATRGNAILRIFNDKEFEDIETVVLNMSSATAGVTSSNLPYAFSIVEEQDFPIDPLYNPLSSSVSSAIDQYLGPNTTVNFFTATGKLLATIQNLSNHDYGCTTVEIDRAGATTTSNAGKTFTTKTFKVTPTNNNATGTHRTTLYYTPEEVSAWTTATGASTSAMSIFKSSGAIGAATSVVEGTSLTVTPFGASTAFAATFSTGFLGFGVANNTVLAVDLLAFEGIKGNKNVKLRWKTASEKNNDYFIIEKSRDGQTFEDMAKVTSQGASSDVLNYETLDNAPVAGMNYYRLKSVDKGGKVATSKIVSVAFVEKIKLTVYPNPTTVSKINVELTSDRDDRIDFEVVDVVGRTVHTMSQNVTNGLNTIAFDNLTVSKGIYFIRAKQNGIVTAVVRFVRL
jgi:Pregnancy-associated plasma protein-A/Secretion system C-terminal sorting domain